MPMISDSATQIVVMSSGTTAQLVGLVDANVVLLTDDSGNVLQGLSS